MALGVLLFTASGAARPGAPVVAAPRVEFAKEVSNPMPRVGDTVTFTLRFSLSSVAPVWVRVFDPNPAPQYLEVLPSTITGGAWYSPTIDGLEWQDMLIKGDPPIELSFQARVLGLPDSAPGSGAKITNMAMMIEPQVSGSLPMQMAQATLYLGASRVWLPVVPLIGAQAGQAGVHNELETWPVAEEEWKSVFLPLVHTGSCSTEREIASPFSLEIAAIHQIENPEEVGASEAAPVWLTLSDSEFSALLDALQESGAGWTRVRLPWRHIQRDAPPADYTAWHYYDGRLARIGAAGIKVIATVADTPDWAGDAPCAPIYPDRLDEFVQFLTDLVNRYKGPPYNIHHWELFNEPDGTLLSGSSGGLGCWADASTDEDGRVYAQMLAVASQAIKAADPNAVVLMGGFAHDWFTEYAGPFDRYFLDDVLKHGGGGHVDALNMHYFRDWHAEWERWDPESEDRRNGWLAAPTCGDLFDGAGKEYEAGGIDVQAKVTHYQNRPAACFGVTKPIWITEIAEHGYAGNAESLARQARYVIQAYARALAVGVENITWYALTTPNDHYEQGLLNDDWTPKPAFYAYRTMTSELTGYEYARTESVVGSEVYHFSDECGRRKTVAWGSGSLTLALTQRARVVDRMGTESTVHDGGTGDADGVANGEIVIALSSEPVFVSTSQ
jgi:hypothetical protein